MYKYNEVQRPLCLQHWQHLRALDRFRIPALQRCADPWTRHSNKEKRTRITSHTAEIRSTCPFRRFLYTKVISHGLLGLLIATVSKDEPPTVSSAQAYVCFLVATYRTYSVVFWRVDSRVRTTGQETIRSEDQTCSD